MLNTPKTHPKNVSQSYCYDSTVYDFNLPNITDVQRGNYRHTRTENKLYTNLLETKSRRAFCQKVSGNKIQKN